MSRDTLYVTRHQGQWELRSDNEQGDGDMPRYDSREDAIDAAILSAQNSSKRGREGRVYVQPGEGEEYKLEKVIEAES
ncbi:hypothetical protein [Pararhizobium mangrovi]|uniref:DUF2188 domain-containing protein n=1 Tax=Pararhizobium mangrovi TaxID=2590452 RepID=A0A506UEL6_9HYPH|nr:hypothetical protein [Pararhizobium mangrovi]TPW31906.1 hypothetical protein FJU11_02810 [Pararhizobium mangrovi]